MKRWICRTCGLLAVLLSVLSPAVTAAGESDSSAQYTDVASGVTFTVPAGWRPKEFFQEEPLLDVKYANEKYPGTIILYGSRDFWSELSPAEQMKNSRDELGSSSMSRAEAAAACGIEIDKIAIVTYGGAEYFKSEETYSAEIYGIPVSTVMSNLFRIEDGWMYSFQFSSDSSHEAYPDFEALLNSVHYPVRTDGVDSGSVSGDTDDLSGWIALATLAVIALIILTVLAVTRKKEAAHATPAPATPTPVVTVTARFCRMCGQALPEDSDFCHQCGTKIYRGDDRV